MSVADLEKGVWNAWCAVGLVFGGEVFGKEGQHLNEQKREA